MIFGRVRFPKEIIDNPAVSMIKQLLNRQPSRRGKPSSLKNHEWFKNMNWEDLYYRAMQPSYTPEVEPIQLANPLRGSVQDIILNDELLDPILYRSCSKAGWDDKF